MVFLLLGIFPNPESILQSTILKPQQSVNLSPAHHGASSPDCGLLIPASERHMPDLVKLFLPADQINLYFIQVFVFIWQF
jgi:hypothetical protein